MLTTQMPPLRSAVLAACLLAAGCRDSVGSAMSQPCEPSPSIEPAAVPGCLALRAIISDGERSRADSLLASGLVLADSLRSTSSVNSFNRAYEVVRAQARLADYYARGHLDDSARFNRLLDQIAVTHEYLRGQLILQSATYQRFVSPSLPGLVWQYYAGQGVQFTPVTSVQVAMWILPNDRASTDSLSRIGEALWRYAIWYPGIGRSFPVWEYQFSFTSGGVALVPPWRSAMAQGYVLVLYTELARRTGDAQWRARADAIYRSFQTLWDDGGVMLADTTHGYWWEEYSPAHRVWNGAAQALIGLTFYAQTTNDPEAKRLAGRGLDAMKHFTPSYDTGSWTLYSRVQGLNSTSYHTLHIQLMDALYQLTGDEWCRSTADRWRSYAPPPGVT